MDLEHLKEKLGGRHMMQSNKVKLIPIQYKKIEYPLGIKPNIQEIPGHFDTSGINPRLGIDYSLHTEPSTESRQFKGIPARLHLLKQSKPGIPHLWTSDEWSAGFFDFLRNLVNGHKPPKIIEIHPPFKSDYKGKGIGDFLRRYMIFEDKVSGMWPDAIVAIENRTGFLVSSADDVANLSSHIENEGCNLKIMLDIPQLLTVHGADMAERLLEVLRPARKNIVGIHLHGKKHFGKLDSLFNGESEAKKLFLGRLHDFLDDGNARYFIPEVNDGKKSLDSIIKDMRDAGFAFGDI